MASSLARAAPPRVAPRATPAFTAARRSRRLASAPTSSSTSLRARAEAGGDDADGATSRAEDAQRWIDAWRERSRDATAASASEARAERESSADPTTSVVSSAPGGDESRTRAASSYRAEDDAEDDAARDDIESLPSHANARTRAKTALLNAARLTDRGLNVGGARRRAALNERVAALEATCPSAFRVRDGDASLESSLESSLEGLLSGVWRLTYTDAFETLAALRIANAMPGVTAGQLTQTVETAAKSRGHLDGANADSSPRRRDETAAPSRLVAVTTMDVSAPLLETRSFVKAELVSVPGSRRCLSARVLEAGVEDARVVDTVSQYVSFPASVTVLGVDVDTEAVAEASDPARNAAKAAVASLGDAVQTLRDAIGAETVAVPVPESFPGARAWTLTTYVDADIRVARGEGGSVYLFEKIRESR